MDGQKKTETWWMPHSYKDGEFSEVEIAHHTEHFVMFPSGRREKRRGWNNYFPTKEEAIEFERNRKMDNVEAGEQDLKNAQNAILHRKAALEAFNAKYPP